MRVMATTLVACKAFETQTFPWTWRVAPRFVEVPIPVRPAVPNMLRMFAVTVLSEVVAKMTGDCIAFEANTLP